MKRKGQRRKKNKLKHLNELSLIAQAHRVRFQEKRLKDQAELIKEQQEFIFETTSKTET